MTPQERQLVDELFDRLAQLETAPRDTQAERAIAEGLARAPNAVYRAGADRAGAGRGAQARRCPHPRIERRGCRAAQRGGGFLDSMRNALTGQPAHSFGAERARQRQRTRSALEQRRRIGRGRLAASGDAGASTWIWRLVPRHRGGLGRRRDRRRAAAQFDQLDVRPSRRQRLRRRSARHGLALGQQRGQQRSRARRRPQRYRTRRRRQRSRAGLFDSDDDGRRRDGVPISAATSAATSAASGLSA